MPRQATAAVTTLGIDIGKNVFHLIGLNKRGAIMLRQKLSRGQVEARLANMAPASSAWKHASVPIIWAVNSEPSVTTFG
jgi:hypothetical protein